jgi:hypothetical protein
VGPIASIFNQVAAGWNANDPGGGSQTTNNYRGGPIAAPAGWNQLSITTTIVNLRLPTGPPAGFTF